MVNAIDVFALCSTFFGITTTLGFGVVQINAGLKILHVLPQTSFSYQVGIVGILVSLAIVSAISGVGKGIKLLSNINIVAAIVLMLFVLTLGPTVYLIGSFTDGIGNYINNFSTSPLIPMFTMRKPCRGFTTGASCTGRGGSRGRHLWDFLLLKYLRDEPSGLL
ncbi:BCCT family transporter [Mucilaginibacter sp. CSA2-8R]|uniref:BCCT family transporter n=1 Tax=Mucilaginibacter sp. CSA2-8R TaxID=3141542 RepID=UPI00315C4D4A